MANRRLSMRKIQRSTTVVLGTRLSVRQAGRSVGISCSTVSDLLYKAKAAGLKWPLSESQYDQALEALLYPTPAPSSVRRPPLDMECVHRELVGNKSVTL